MYCQKCRTPIHIDDSLDNLNPASFKILIDSTPALTPQVGEESLNASTRQRRDLYGEASQNAAHPKHKRVVPEPIKGSSTTNPAMSFVMLTDSHLGSLPTPDVKEQTRTKSPSSLPTKPKAATQDDTPQLSQKLERQLRLFDILSGRSDVDHPVCSECSDMLIHGLQHRQTLVTRERDAYTEFLKRAQQSVPTEEEQRKVNEDLVMARAAEASALKDLEALESEKALLEDELAALEQEEARLDDEEQDFWARRNLHDRLVAEQLDERTSLQNRLANDTKILEALQRTNVYNDSFCIGHDGHFGTINGLRLGRLADHPVDWPEINAAWGQAVLLLVVVAEKLGYTFDGYKLLPVGSTSKIQKLEWPQSAASQTSPARGSAKPKVTQFDLYSSGDLPLGLGFLHRGFDNAMTCFLDCLRQLGDFVERTSGTPRPDGTLDTLALPYRIDKDKIGGTSIKLGAFGQEEQWTKACKFTLTCCKYLLAHASHVDDMGSRPHR